MTLMTIYPTSSSQFRRCPLHSVLRLVDIGLPWVILLLTSRERRPVVVHLVALALGALAEQTGVADLLTLFRTGTMPWKLESPSVAAGKRQLQQGTSTGPVDGCANKLQTEFTLLAC